MSPQTKNVGISWKCCSTIDLLEEFEKSVTYLDEAYFRPVDVLSGKRAAGLSAASRPIGSTTGLDDHPEPLLNQGSTAPDIAAERKRRLSLEEDDGARRRKW